MGTTWILVADASRAKLYSQAEPSGLMSVLQEFEHAASRLKGSQLSTDRPGRFLHDGGGHGSYDAHTDPKVYEADRFAQELAQVLEKGRATNSFQKLVVVAPAHFSGELNRHLSTHTRERIDTSIDRDYTQLPQKELAERIRDYARH